jgi:hypothetical protein
MLTIDPPFYQLHGVTIFRDHADPTQFYYLPPVPRLVRNDRGEPALTIYKYRRDLTDNPALDPTRARGAGLALFETEVPLDRRILIESELPSMSGQPEARLTPVVFRSGQVSAILARHQNDELIEDLAHVRPAPLTAPHRAAFSLALTAEGATLFEQAALGGQLPIGVAYDLRFLALTPAVQARVWMDYDRTYDRFAASAGFSYYVSVKLDLDLQWLREHDVIRIEIIAFTDEEDRERQERLVMGLVKARIQNDFFRSAVPERQEAGLTGPLADLLGGLLGGEVSSATALFVLKARFEAVRERKEFELRFDSRTAVELTHVATGLLATMLETDDPDAPGPKILEIDLDDEFFSALEVRISAAVDFDQMADLREVHVHVEKGDHRQATTFRPGPEGAPPNPVFRAPLTDRRDDEYAYTVDYHFDADAGHGPTRITAGPFRSRSRVLVVDPFEHVRYRRVRLLLGPVDPALVPRVHVQVRAAHDDSPEDLSRATVLLGQDASEVVWRQRLPIEARPPRVFARPDWEDPRGELHRGREREVAGDSLVVLGPYVDLLEISVLPGANWDDVTQVLVELRYRDDDYLVERRLTFSAAQADSQIVAIPLRDRRHRTYDWRQIVFRADGERQETAWAQADTTLLLVGQQVRPRDVEVVWVGDPGDALGLRVDFLVATAAGDDESRSVFLRPGQSSVTVTLPPGPDGRLSYRFEASRIDASGARVVKRGEDQRNLLVVQSGT